MAGYDRNAWKSNNAVQAEEIGMKTASALAEVLKKKVQASDIEEVFEREAWHHTSGRFNRTNYYWEPVVEFLATKPSISNERLRDVLRCELAADLRTATDERDIWTIRNLQTIVEDDRAFAEHVEEKKMLLSEVYKCAMQRIEADRGEYQVIANVSYKVFAFSHRLGRSKLVEEVELWRIPVSIKGDWATFLKDGQKTRKKISGNTFNLDIIENASQATG